MISNLTRHTTIASKVQIAQDPMTRMKGLLGRDNLSQGEALVITQCQSIHMFFMKFPIDVIFCNQNNKVVGCCENINPFCLSPIFFKASYAIELPSGSIAISKTEIGDQIDLPLTQ
jgi:uncharacterized membrane protein (UPF0127 family)